MMIVLAGLLAIGCETRPPDPLPPPRYAAPTVLGRVVRHDGVHGYLSRPRDRGATTGQAIVLLVPALDDAVRQRSDARAESGAIVLSVPPTTDTDRAVGYLRGFPQTTEVIIECLRERC
jgi:hypothetical protein